MSNVRAIITFLVVLGIVLLAMFQMDLRGYDEITRINEFVLYETTVETCKDQLYFESDVEYRIDCENKYLLKSGFTEYTVTEALDEKVVDREDLLPYVIID